MSLEEMEADAYKHAYWDNIDKPLKVDFSDVKRMVDEMVDKLNKTIHFTIQSKPIAKARARFRKYGKTYDPQEKEKERWQWEAKHQLNEQGLGPLKLIGGPVNLRVSFVFQTPKNTPKKDMEKLNNGIMMWHDKRPDLDNLIKFVKDCLNQFIYKDDSQVVYIAAMKVYGLHAETQVEIEEI